MNGIRLLGKERAVEKEVAKHSVLDFTFADIMNCIEELISDIYWAHTGIIYSFSERLTQEMYERIKLDLEEYCLHEDTARSRYYMHRGFIENFGKYIYSDWLEIAGYDDIQKLKTFDPTDSDAIKDNALVFVRCVDAKYWVIYSNNDEIINLLDSNFKFTEKIVL